MGGHDADELARRDHLGSLPEPWEMPLVTGHQIVDASCRGQAHARSLSGLGGWRRTLRACAPSRIKSTVTSELVSDFRSVAKSRRLKSTIRHPTLRICAGLSIIVND